MADHEPSDSVHRVEGEVVMLETLDRAEQRKLTLNQVLLREVNEQIRSLSTSFGDAGMISVVCECSRNGCMALLPISIEEYETVRAIPTRFLLAEGHEVTGLETIVEQTAEYLVVEKVGASAAVAIRMDPRGYPRASQLTTDG